MTQYERTIYFAGKIVDMINETVGADHVLRKDIEQNPTEFFFAFGVVAPHHIYKTVVDEDMEALDFTHLMNRLLVQSMLEDRDSDITIEIKLPDDVAEGGAE